MRNNTLPFQVAGIIFFVVALLHLLRMIFNISVTVGGRMIPLWVSVGGFFFAAGLSWWIFKSLKKG